MPENIFAQGQLIITMSPGQWDYLLEAAYDEGATLLEVDVVNGREAFVGAYRKQQNE